MTHALEPFGTELPDVERRPRVLWSPVVHRALNESCYFFVLTCTHSRGFELQEQLRAIHDSLGIHGVAFYIVQGPYDLIVRVWLTTIRRQAYLDRLESRSNELSLASLYEFSADHVNYCWLKDEQVVQQRNLARSQTDLTRGLRNELLPKLDEATLEPLPAARPGLTARGLLIDVEDPTPRRLFMFISYDYEFGQRHGAKVHDDLSAAAIDVGLEEVSIYRGRGFCDLILKGFFPAQFGEMLKIISALQDRLANVGMVGWTLSPIGVTYIGGGESIDAISDDSLKVLAEMLQHSQDQYFDDDELRKHLDQGGNAEFVEGFLSALEVDRLKTTNPSAITRLRRRMQSIIAGLLTGSRKRVNRELSFLVSIPTDLRDVLALLQSGEVSSDMDQSFDTDISGLCNELTLELKSGRDVSPGVPLDSQTLINYSLSATNVRRQFFQGGLLTAAYKTVFDADVGATLNSVADAALLQMHLESLRDALIAIAIDGE